VVLTLLLGRLPFDQQREDSQAKVRDQFEEDAVSMDVLMNAIKFSLSHVAHQANIDRALDAESLNDGAVMIFHAEMLAIGKPVENLHSIFFIMGPRPPGRFRQRRDLLEALEGVAGWPHDPHTVIGDQLREAIHIVGHRSNLQIVLNECLIGLTEGVSHRCTCFLC
jgi:hypothetical protein